MSNIDLTEKRRSLPIGPGVYLFKDVHGEVLYIGKAASLRKRVAQYFSGRDQSPKITVMVGHIRDIDFIETPTEADALLFEAALINKYEPKYNTRLKDDKSYPLIVLTKENFPRLYVTHAKDLAAARAKGKGSYFGPYTDATLLREAVHLIHATFPIRKCRTLPTRSCVYYHIKQCIAPCIHRDEITVRQYNELVEDIASFLGSGKRSLIAYLTARMKEASAGLRFEEAGAIKKRIEALENLSTKRFQGSGEHIIAGMATRELARSLGLSVKKLDRIVCLDVSNLMGKWAVASKVSFSKELPDKNDYRRYKIRTVAGINDYDMMREAVGRMSERIIAGDDARPDLIMIDGGKGHLQAAATVLGEKGLAAIPVVALAKRFEMLFSVNCAPLLLPDGAPALYLVKKIRDEAHRFAVDYHNTLRLKEVRVSALDRVPGIGERKKELLLKRFGSVRALQSASIDELTAVPGISKKLALAITTVIAKDSQNENDQ